jgi:predicted component of type VI protein secretion system
MPLLDRFITTTAPRSVSLLSICQQALAVLQSTNTSGDILALGLPDACHQLDTRQLAIDLCRDIATQMSQFDRRLSELEVQPWPSDEPQSMRFKVSATFEQRNSSVFFDVYRHRNSTQQQAPIQVKPQRSHHE